jgi:hypothetical protein
MDTARKCCPECFADRGLRKNIIPRLSKERGVCSSCGTSEVDLVDPVQLQESFEALVSIYERDDKGRLLVEWLKEDWAMFHPSMDVARRKELLADVLDNGEIVRQAYTPSAKYRSDGLARWEKLRTELMHENRYFPDAQLNTDRLKQLFGHLHADDVPLEWYRARLQTGDTVFALEDMGAPPQRIAGHGRANPAGIPYLYLGSTPETAVSETRPHTGEKVCVADFSIPPYLTLLDLRNPRALVPPFDIGDEDQIGLLRSDIDFLERLGQELTLPILPQGAMIDYVPSQYLCEFIKKCGYAGVIYRSSVSEGINLALFKPTHARPIRVRPYVIQQVSVTVQEI